MTGLAPGGPSGGLYGKAARDMILEQGAMPTRPLRVAFVTPEYVTEISTAGGLSNYLGRMTAVLRDMGHCVEVFVLSKNAPGRLDFEGIAVHRVAPAIRHLGVRLAYRVNRVLQSSYINGAIDACSGAIALARALAERERMEPFDFVQSSDYLASGLFVKRTRSRPHLVRCSSAVDLCAEVQEDRTPAKRAVVRLQLMTIRRADLSYAPSWFLTEYYRRKYGLPLCTIRPPAFIEANIALEMKGASLPGRFFVHFGQLTQLKGTCAVLDALPLVWAREPGFRLVLAGPSHDATLDNHREMLDGAGNRVIWLGPVPKTQLHTVLRRSEAAVLPSLVDNLPNTVIECLCLGIPVIGFRGASVDELVEPGISGELVEMGDVPALAEVMIKCWRGLSSARKGFVWDSPVAQEMQPRRAAERLLAYACGARERVGASSVESSGGL